VDVSPVVVYRFTHEEIQKCPSLLRLIKEFGFTITCGYKTYYVYREDFDEVRIGVYATRRNVWLKFQMVKDGKEIEAVDVVVAPNLTATIGIINGLFCY